MTQADRGPLGKTMRRAHAEGLRRADTLEAAFEVFAERGYEGAPMSEIASRAQVSLASLYALFESKDALYRAVIEHAAERMSAEVVARVEALSGSSERLLGVIDALLACFDEDRRLLRIYASATGGLPWRIREGLGERALQVYQDFVDWVGALAREARGAGVLASSDPREFAIALVGAVSAAAADRIERRPDPALSAAAPSLRAIFSACLTCVQGDRS
ncbi:MAG: TetR family transcriptional regulator [Myxococcota bacterium]